MPKATEAADANTDIPAEKKATSKIVLTVTQPFLSYKHGDVIESENDINEALTKFAHCVVKTNAPA